MRRVLFLVLVGVFLCGGSASATLIDRGGGLIYDDVLDVTWLQDANYAGKSMNWYESVSWVEGLEYYDPIRDVTWDDWRLPRTVDGPYTWGVNGSTTAGYNIVSSELGYMYYVNLGNLGMWSPSAVYPQSDWGLNNTGPFVNLNPKFYWSGTEYATDPDAAWFLDFKDGYQIFYYKTDPNSLTWAVRDGDVAAPVPEPATILLLGTGLIGIAGGRRKRKK